MTEVVDLSKRRQPVTYTVTITHHWDDSLEVFVADLADDDRSRASVADALYRAAHSFGLTQPAPTLAEALGPEVVALEAAFLAGFKCSHEGYNGEYPFSDGDNNPADDKAWCNMRDLTLAALKGGAA